MPRNDFPQNVLQGVSCIHNPAGSRVSVNDGYVDEPFRLHKTDDVMQQMIALAGGDRLCHHCGKLHAVDNAVVKSYLSHDIDPCDCAHHDSFVIARDRQGSMGVGHRILHFRRISDERKGAAEECSAQARL